MTQPEIDPTLRGLLDECKAHPRDDLPRFVLADWLEEHGQADRAEHVRLETQYDSLDDKHPLRGELERRSSHLFQLHKKAWCGSLLDLGIDCWSYRGLVHIRLDADKGSDEGLDALAGSETLAWVGLVCLAVDDDASEDVPKVLDQPWVSDVGGVALDSLDDDPVLARIMGRCRRLGGHGRFDMDGAGIDAEGVRLIGGSPHLGNVTWLNLSRDELGNMGMAALTSTPLLPRLERLDIDGNDIEPAGALTLANAPPGRLQHLVLSENPLGSRGLRALVSGPFLSSCTRLDLAECNITDAGLRALAASPHVVALTSLDLSHNQLGTTGLRALARSPHLAKLQRLRLHDTQLTAEAVAALAGARQLDALAVLDLSSNPLGKDGARPLFASPLLGRLRELYLNGSGVADTSLAGLRVATVSPTLEVLNLAGTSVGNRGLGTLARSPLVQRLQMLDLGHTRVGGAGVAALADGQSPLPLTVLNLEYCDCGDAGALALAESGALVNLAYLDLNHTRITDRGAVALARSHALAKLRTLDLGSNKIRARGAKALIASPYLAGLRHLGLYNNPLGEKTRKALEKRFKDALHL